ncbi:MAG: hypothetical protein C0595_10220 [Marinilabiliales bacterium]|nr:MAG: hypothetical protein C0595_10220 [Marinilabiliales bacterium]
MKKFYLIIAILFLYCSIKSQTKNSPIAQNDTITTISESEVIIDVLLNDYDPDGDEIEVRNILSPQHGDAYEDGTYVYYTADFYVGKDSLKYKIKDINCNVSDYAWIFITVDTNTNIPVAVNDTFSVTKLVPTGLNLIENDTDPNGDEIKIFEVRKLYSGYDIEISEDSLSVLFTSDYPLEREDFDFEYRIIEKDTETGYYSDWVSVFVESIENPDIPTAVADAYETAGGIPVDCYVLENDINPSEATLNIIITSNPEHGAAEVVGNHIVYTPDYSYQGNDFYTYKIFLEEFPCLYSKTQNTIDVAKNESCPVAVNDIENGNCGEEVVVDVLANDYDPDGADIEIMEIEGGYFTTLEVVDNKVVYSQIININTNSDEFRYRIREVNNPDSYSEWAKVKLELEQNSDYPIAEKDYASVVAGQSIEIDVLQNDLIDGFNPEVFPVEENQYGLLKKSENNTLIFSPYMSVENTTVNLVYMLRDNEVTYMSFGEIEVNITQNKSYDSLDINNINAGIHSDGFLFCNLNEVIDENPSDFSPHFEFPKGSGLHTIFSSAIWIGGLDENDSLHLAAQRYKQVGYDFQAGPVSSDYSGDDYFAKWNRLWKLNKTDVNYHRNNYWKEGYVPIDAIISWPGSGDIDNGQAEKLAPFYDKNNNGVYEPMEGDHPLIRGDQTVLFIFNDDRTHTETKGGSMKVEIHGMAYAYNQPEDNLLNNTVFVHYDVYNRSQNTYHDTYFASWTDLDIGYAFDDYVGSDVVLSSFFGYNGYETDPNYGENPPVQSVTILSGSLMDSDNIDNPVDNCSFGVNGQNFGDGIVDNERFGMTRFIYNNNSSGNTGDPNIAPEYYNYLKGLSKDGTPIFPDGPDCLFMFPGDSDPCDWGTEANLPNGAYNLNGPYWTEESVGNEPGDRRGLGVTGPFTFNSGDIQEIELAYAIGQGDGNTSSYEQLIENLNDLFNRMDEGEIIVPNESLAVAENKPQKSIIQVYPNPSRKSIYLNIVSEISVDVEYSIYNSMGNNVLNDYMKTNSQYKVDISKLIKGLYIIKLHFDNKTYQKKFIKL